MLASMAVGGGGFLWTSTRNSTRMQNAFRHFQSHGAEFGVQNSLDYVRRAQSFLWTPPAGTLTRVRQSNGDVVRYHPPTNTFGVMDANGTPRTMFKPDPVIHGYPTNLDYFNAQ